MAKRKKTANKPKSKLGGGSTKATKSIQDGSKMASKKRKRKKTANKPKSKLGGGSTKATKSTQDGSKMASKKRKASSTLSYEPKSKRGGGSVKKAIKSEQDRIDARSSACILLMGNVNNNNRNSFSSTSSSASDDVDINLQSMMVKSLIKKNSRLWKQCLKKNLLPLYLQKDNDFDFSKYNYDTDTTIEGKFIVMTRIIFLKAEVQSTEVIAYPEFDAKVFTLPCIPEHLQEIFPFNYSSSDSLLPDYKAYLKKAFMLHDSILGPFLIKLKKHQEDIQRSIESIDSWFNEAYQIRLSLIVMFGKNILEAINIPKNSIRQKQPPVVEVPLVTSSNPYALGHTEEKVYDCTGYICLSCGKRAFEHMLSYGSYICQDLKSRQTFYKLNEMNALLMSSEASSIECKASFDLTEEKGRDKLKKYVDFIKADDYMDRNSVEV